MSILLQRVYEPYIISNYILLRVNSVYEQNNLLDKFNKPNFTNHFQQVF